MSRDLTGSVLTAISSEAVRIAFFVEIDFTGASSGSGPVRLWSGVTNISWDSKTWIGTGALLTLKPAGESSTLLSQGMEISLTGIDPTYIALALDEARQGQPVNCWLGFIDSAGAVIADPTNFFNGRLDLMLINEGAEFSTVTVRAESRLIDLGKRRFRRYTHEDQKKDYPSDLGFEHMAAIQDWNGQWGGGAIGGADADDFGNPVAAEEAEAEAVETEGAGYDPPEAEAPAPTDVSDYGGQNDPDPGGTGDNGDSDSDGDGSEGP